jgi:3-hydroxybutyryl-CoA dehydrogenase
MLNQAAYVFESTGLESKIIDNAMRDVCGHKLGPLATLDMIGIDVSIDIIEELNRRKPELHLPVAEILYEMKKAGTIGRKSGMGFYRYN